MLSVRDRDLRRSRGEPGRHAPHSALQRAAGVRDRGDRRVLRAQARDGARSGGDRRLPCAGPGTRAVQSAGRILVLPRGRLVEGGGRAALLRIHVRSRRLLHLPSLPPLRPPCEPLPLAACGDLGGSGVRELLHPSLAAGRTDPDRARFRPHAVAEPGQLHRRHPEVRDAAQPLVRADRLLPVGRRERRDLAGRLAVSRSSRFLAGGARRKVGLLGTAGELELRPGRRRQAGRGPVLQLTAAPGPRLRARTPWCDARTPRINAPGK